MGDLTRPCLLFVKSRIHLIGGFYLTLIMPNPSLTMNDLAAIKSTSANDNPDQTGYAIHMNWDEFSKRCKYGPVRDKLGEGGFGDVFKGYGPSHSTVDSFPSAVAASSIVQW
jgi:hypothetical protein